MHYRASLLGEKMIPKTIEEVTPKWLSKILDIEITDMGVIKIAGGDRPVGGHL